jgi:hypothetical protein
MNPIITYLSRPTTLKARTSHLQERQLRKPPPHQAYFHPKCAGNNGTIENAFGSVGVGRIGLATGSKFGSSLVQSLVQGRFKFGLPQVQVKVPRDYIILHTLLMAILNSPQVPCTPPLAHHHRGGGGPLGCFRSATAKEANNVISSSPPSFEPSSPSSLSAASFLFWLPPPSIPVAFSQLWTS